MKLEGLIKIFLGVLLVPWLFSCSTLPEREFSAAHLDGGCKGRTHRVLALAVSFPDVRPEKSIQRLKKRFIDQMARYFAEESYGKVCLSGEIKGWYELPGSLDEYKISAYTRLVDRRKVWQLVLDAFNAAEHDVQFDDYDHIAIIVGVRTRAGVGYGMIAYTAHPGYLSVERRGPARQFYFNPVEIKTKHGQIFSGGITVAAENVHPGFIAVDYAVVLGGIENGKRVVPMLWSTAAHIPNRTREEIEAYMGPWDILSCHYAGRNKPPPGMSSFSRLRLGWIDNDQVVQVQLGASRGVVLSPLASGKGVLAIKIPGPEGSYFLLENRQKMAGDPVLPTTGLLVLQVDESIDDGEGIVKVINADPDVAYFGAATFGLAPNQKTSVRLTGDIAVELLWQEDRNLCVMVTNLSLAEQVQELAQRIRKTEQRLKDSRKTEKRLLARERLKAAKELLFQANMADADRILTMLEHN